MSISFELPKIFEDELRGRWGNLDEAARDALLIESYRQGMLSLGELSDLVGLGSRFDAEAWLRKRGVFWNYDIELSVTGTLGILDAAAERGLVVFEEAIGQLRTTDFSVSERLLASLLRERERLRERDLEE
ncbi:MAG: UPF0175 family protein [Planctomycetota bacterium]